MEDVRIVLGVTAAVVSGTAYYLYPQQSKQEGQGQNIATWSIWTLLAIINAFTWKGINGDWVGALQFFMGSVACAVTFIRVLVIGHFSWPKRWDHWLMFALGLVASVVWYKYQQAEYANMIVLTALIISFIPQWEGVFENPFVERPRSWVLWTVAYVITTVNVMFRPDWQLVSLVMPVCMVFAHGAVAVLSTEARKRKYKTR